MLAQITSPESPRLRNALELEIHTRSMADNTNAQRTRALSPAYPSFHKPTRIPIPTAPLGIAAPETTLHSRNRGDLVLGLSGGLLGLGLLGGGLGALALLLLGGLGTRAFSLSIVGRGPEGKVVAQQLHDQGAVTVRLLGKRVELGNSVIKGLLGKVASTVRRVQDLVVENGEVEGKTQADGMRRGELGLSDVRGVL